MWHDKFSNVKISKLSASPESEHLNNEKKKTYYELSHLHRFLKFKQFMNKYLWIYLRENTSNVSKQSGNYILTSYAEGQKKRNTQILSPFRGNSNAFLLLTKKKVPTHNKIEISTKIYQKKNAHKKKCTYSQQNRNI